MSQIANQNSNPNTEPDQESADVRLTRAERELDRFAQALGVGSKTERAQLLVEMEKMPRKLLVAVKCCIVDDLGLPIACAIQKEFDASQVDLQVKDLYRRFNYKKDLDQLESHDDGDDFMEFGYSSGDSPEVNKSRSFSATLKAKERSLAIALMQTVRLPAAVLGSISIKWVTASEFSLIGPAGEKLELDKDTKQRLDNYFQTVKDEGLLDAWHSDGSRLFISGNSWFDFEGPSIMEDSPLPKVSVSARLKSGSVRRGNSAKKMTQPKVKEEGDLEKDSSIKRAIPTQRSEEESKGKQSISVPAFAGLDIKPRSPDEPKPENEISHLKNIDLGARGFFDDKTKELWLELNHLRKQEVEATAVPKPLDAVKRVKELRGKIVSTAGVDTQAVTGARMELELLEMRLESQSHTKQDLEAVKLVNSTLLAITSGVEKK